jgi:hypothetical protein
VGSLALAGIDVAWELVRSEEELPPPADALRRAQRLESARVALDGPGLVALSRLIGGELRTTALSRPDGPPTAAPDRIEAGLLSLGEWLGAESVRALAPAAAGALVLVRVLEISPLAKGNGRLSRLAAADVMSGRGAKRPILVAGDRSALSSAAEAAYRLETRPLAALLEEAASRWVEVMIQALEGGWCGDERQGQGE